MSAHLSKLDRTHQDLGDYNIFNYYTYLLYGPLFIAGPLGNIATSCGSRANSRANSRTGSKENLCEDCVQNPLDLVDASIQVIRIPQINFFLGSVVVIFVLEQMFCAC